MRINIEINDRPVLDAFRRLRRAGGDLSPVMRDIGDALVRSTRRRFEPGQERAPSGEKWAALSPRYKARKPRLKDRILVLDSYLGSGIESRPGKDYVEVGSTTEYASTHQFGAAKGAFGSSKRGLPIPWGDIPARPFLGLSDGDRENIVDILRRHIAKALR